MHGKTTIRNESGSVQVYAVYDTPSAQDKAIHIRVPLLRKVSCYAQEAELQTSGKQDQNGKQETYTILCNI